MKNTMKKMMTRLPLAALSIPFALLFASNGFAATPGAYAILIGGGFTFNSTYVSDYNGIKDLKAALLKRAVPESQILTYFAEGCHGDGNVRIAAVLKKPCGFFTAEGHDIDQSNALSNVLAGFARFSSEIPSGGTLVVGIATHGEKNGDLDLQEHTKLTIAKLRSLIAPLEARGVRTILISTACYSGNLHKLSSTNTCAFTASDDKHLTAEVMGSKSLMSEMADSFSNGSDFLTAFEDARATEAAKKISLNSHYTNGMDAMSASLFKGQPVEMNTERLETYQKKTGYDRFDTRFLDLFAPPTAYFDAIRCSQTTF